LTNDACHNDLVPDVVARRIDDKIKALEIPDYDLSLYALKSELPSIEGLATETYVDKKVAAIKIPEVDFSDYATKAELFSKDYNELINKPEIPEAELYKVDFNAPDYVKAVEAYNNGKVLVLVNAAPDINSYAIMNYVSEKYIAFTKFLTSRSEAYGSFNTYYLSPANT
jgi:hypothetical protein